MRKTISNIAFAVAVVLCFTMAIVAAGIFDYGSVEFNQLKRLAVLGWSTCAILVLMVRGTK